MRDLNQNERALWEIMYEVCVMTPKFLDMEPFQPTRFHAEVIRTYSKKKIAELIKLFEDVLETHSIDFENNPLMKNYPKVKNEHIYLSIKKHLDYFKKEWNY